MFDNPLFQRLVERDQPTGEVISVDRSLIRVKGLEAVGTNALVLFENGCQGLVRESAEEGTLILNMSTDSVPLGCLVVLQDQTLQVGVGDALIGRVVSPSGRPIDGQGPIYLTKSRPVFTTAPGVITRSVLSQQITTGVGMVDFLFPVLRGQRVAILGDSKAGKSAFLSQMTVSQMGTDMVVIYCLIAKRKVDVDALMAKLHESGAIKNTIVVVASVFDALATSFIAPYAACAMGEEMWFQGRHVVMVYDDLTGHAKVYRELSLLARGNPGRESYPGDMFYAHSSLLERAGKLADGGGTMTALPVVLTPGNDVTANLPTSLISITDGQIVFDLDKFRQGVRPAVNHGLSVSRVGGRGQNKRQKGLTQKLVRGLIDYHAAEEFARFGSEMSDEAHNSLAVGKRIYEAFKQPVEDVYTITEQELYLNATVDVPGKDTLDVEAAKKMARQLAPTITNDDQMDAAIAQIIEKCCVRAAAPEPAAATPAAVAQ